MLAMRDLPPISRKTSAAIGGLFLLAIFAYATGNGLFESLLKGPASIGDHTAQAATGACLMLLNSLAVAGIGVLMLPVLTPYSKTMAYGYLSARLIESIVLIVGIISLLSLLPISRATVGDPQLLQTLVAVARHGQFAAYQIAMAVLGVGSVLFCYGLFQLNLIPRFMAVWGLIGYLLLATGAVLELFGIPIGIIMAIPGGLFELAVGLFLIFKGFKS